MLHLIPNLSEQSGTDKIKLARKRYKNVKIVAKEWLYDSISSWCRQPEERYVLPPSSPSFPGSPSPSPSPSLQPPPPQAESKNSDTDAVHSNIADDEDDGALTGTEESVRP